MLRFLGVILLLVLVLAGVGLWRGWFSLSSTTNESGKKSYTIEVDEDKLGEDVDRVKDKLAKVTSGAIEKIDAAANTITVKTEAGDVEVPVDESTSFKLGDDVIKLGDLKPGDRLRIDWREVDGKKIAGTITAERD